MRYISHQKLIASLIKRQQSNRDCCLILTAPEREGKSIVGITLGLEYCKQKNIAFDLEANIGYTPVDTRTKIGKLKKYEWFQDDESLTSKDTGRTLSTDQFLDRIIFRQMGFKYLLMLIVAQDIADLGKYFRRRGNVWIHVLKRFPDNNKLCMVFRKSRDPMVKGDPWGLDSLPDKVRNNPARTSYELSKKLQKLPTFRGYMMVPAIDEGIIDQYNAVSEDYKQDQLESSEAGAFSKIELGFGQTIYNLKRVKKWTWPQIELITGYTRRQLSTYEKRFRDYATV